MREELERFSADFHRADQVVVRPAVDARVDDENLVVSLQNQGERPGTIEREPEDRVAFSLDHRQLLVEGRALGVGVDGNVPAKGTRGEPKRAVWYTGRRQR